MPRVLVSDPIATEGIELLRQQADVDVKTGLSAAQLASIIGEYDALVVRSETRVTAQIIEAGRKLQVIGRAGVGVDNIDLQAATSKGVAVVNSPTGNTVAAAEHTMALLLSLARRVPQACASLKQGEWRRNDFLGVELRDKTLGVVGLGKVGSEVVRRARGFQMRIIACDPFVSPEYARTLGVELTSLATVLQQADFLTLHTPLAASTRNLLGAREFEQVKPGIRIVNAARGELIDEEALLAALDSGRVAGAALDVFAQEPPGDRPVVKHPNVVVTPHLGASTLEAQREVALEVAQQVLKVLKGEPAQYTVNVPVMPPEVHAVLAPYLPVATLVGKLLTQLAQGQPPARTGGQFLGATITYEGEIARLGTVMLKSAVLMGLLGAVSEERVNLINAPVIAQRRGLRIDERKQAIGDHYGSLVTVTLHTGSGDLTMSGTLLRGEAHIVRVNDYWLDMVPSVPYLLFIEHRDRPGMIGTVGTITGKHDINISFMEVGRLAPRGRAMMVLGLDDPMPPSVQAEIAAVPDIYNVRLVSL